MENGKPREDRPPKGWLARLERAAEKMNAFLLVIAIGLGVLDFTCFWVLQIRDTLPAVTRVEPGAATASKSAAPARHNLAQASSARIANSAAGF